MMTGSPGERNKVQWKIDPLKITTRTLNFTRKKRHKVTFRGISRDQQKSVLASLENTLPTDRMGFI